MFSIMKRCMIVGAILVSVMAMAQTQALRETLMVQGYQGQATVIRNRGRVFLRLRFKGTGAIEGWPRQTVCYSQVRRKQDQRHQPDGRP